MIFSDKHYTNALEVIPKDNGYYHCENRQSHRIIKKVAVTLFIIGILALLGAALGLMAAHGVFPPSTALHLAFFASHKWIFLSVGAGGVVEAFILKWIEHTLGKVKEYEFKSQIKKHIEEINKKNPSNFITILSNFCDELDAGIGEKYRTLEAGQKKQVFYQDRESVVKIEDITVPNQLYLIVEKESKGYTVHYYQNQTEFNHNKALLEGREPKTWESIVGD